MAKFMIGLAVGLFAGAFVGAAALALVMAAASATKYREMQMKTGRGETT